MLPTEMNYQALLERVTALNEKYKGIAEITGENYNIFKILGVESSEVRLHSAFLANLLNTKGSHGQKDSFLKAFIQEFKLDGFEAVDKIEAKVSIEKPIGNIVEDYSSGGRIDIEIKPEKGKIIVIENKIYAGDQPKQLIRYRKAYPVAHLLYLTLNGAKPGKSSIQNVDGKQLESGEDYYCISYETGILNWLKICKEKAVNHPILRETITQYIYLIKKLTGQTMNDEMKKGIVDIISEKGDYISASIEIANAVNAVKEKLYKKFAEKLATKVSGGDVVITTSEMFGTEIKEGIKIRLSDSTTQYIRLYFLSDKKNFFFDIVNIDHAGKQFPDTSNYNYYRKELNNPAKANGWKTLETNPAPRDWVGQYTRLNDFFSDSEKWAAIADGKDDEMVDKVSKDISELINVFRNKPTKKA